MTYLMKIEEYMLWICCAVHSRFGDPLLLGSGVTTYHSRIESMVFSRVTRVAIYMLRSFDQPDKINGKFYPWAISGTFIKFWTWYQNV